IVVRFFPLATTQFARARACSIVIGVSTRTASRSPEIRVDEIGGPRSLFFAWRQIARDSGYAGRQEHVPTQRRFSSVLSGLRRTGAGLPVRGTELVCADWRRDCGNDGCSEPLHQEFTS